MPAFADAPARTNMRREPSAVALVVALAFAEACLFAPVLTPLRFAEDAAQQAGLFQLAFGLCALALLAVGLTRLWIGNRDDGTRALRFSMTALAALIALAIYLLFENTPGERPQLGVLVAPLFGSAVLIWRGNAIGSMDASPTALRRRLQLNTMGLMLATLWMLIIPGVNFIGVTLAFFAAWMVALPISQIRHTAEDRYGRAVRTTWRWWLTLIIAVLGCLTLATLAVALVTGESVGVLLYGVLVLLALPAMVVAWLIPQGFFDWLSGFLSRRGLTPNSLGEQASGRQWLADLFRNNGDPNAVDLNTLLALGVLLIALALILLSMRAKRAHEIERAREPDDYESALPMGAAQPSSAARRSLGSLRRWLAVMTVRRLYLRAERDAAKRGFQRQPAQTPHEFLPKLQAAFPQAQQEAAALTDAYALAHYGEVPDSPEALDRLRAQWSRMRASPPHQDAAQR